ncbi:agmatinase [Patescibacteria group bacterium]|nr:agmatinase [Patescibacteria group bacterium]
MKNYKNVFYANREIFRRDKNFLGLDSPFSDFEFAKSVILPVPYDATTSIKSGTRNGPEEIIRAAYLLEEYEEELGTRPCQHGIHTLNEIEPDLRGPNKMVERIYGVWKELLKDEKFVLMLGGEHTVSGGAVKALKEKHESFSVLQLDAHADIRDNYEGTEFNHACAANQMIKYADNIVQVGIRCVAPEELDNIKNFKDRLHIVYAKDVNHEYVKDKKWIEKVIDKLGDKVYLSFDLDALDPSIMPAVGTPLPGGLGYYQSLELIKRVFETKEVIGADLVELCPLPENIAPNYLAAKIAYKILGYKFDL